jgi:hypothetical protein
MLVMILLQDEAVEFLPPMAITDACWKFACYIATVCGFILRQAVAGIVYLNNQILDNDIPITFERTSLGDDIRLDDLCLMNWKMLCFLRLGPFRVTCG